MSSLDYCIDARATASRRLQVILELDRSVWDDVAAADRGVLFLPTWTPGSYLIREYSRHFSRVVAEDAETGASLDCRKVAKNRFRVSLPAATRRIRATYSVYAHELSVRTADLTTEHAYWNHACILLWPVGRPSIPARLRIRIPSGWDLATSLPRVDGSTAAATHASPAHGDEAAAIELAARDLDHVVDSPCLAGRFLRVDWTVDGVPHAAVLDGLGPVRPPASLIDDLTAIVRSTVAVFGGACPYERYLFLCLFAADGHGGLEHADSTTLLASRTAVRSEAEYKQFLALAAHELFHAWNAKRLRPVEFWTYDYEAENYTSLLWLIEGWTSYYDDLLCLRAGVISVSDYLAALEKAITTMAQGVGRFRLSLEESSFDAWIRLYRPDEDTFNSSQNYYGNGSIAALCTDLTIRSATEGRCSLDDVLRELYADTFTDGRGYTADDVLRIAAGIAGDSVAAEIARFVGGTFDPDLVALFAAVGVRLTWKDRERPHLGLAFQSGTTKVATVIADSPAEIGGLAPGDEVLALDGVRVTSESWQELLGALATVGAPLQVLVASRGLVGQRTVTPKAGRGTAQVALDESASPSQAALRAAWLKTRGPRAEGGAAKNASVRGPEPRPSV